MYDDSSDDSSAYGYGSGPEDSGDDGEYAEDSGDEGFPTCHVCDRVFNRGNSWRDNEHAKMQHMKTHDVSATCPFPTCKRVFSKGRTRAENLNSMEQHKMVHIERKVSCPVCGETRFRTSDGAVQHVESGACSGCRGQERARKNVYQFLNQQEMGRSLLNKQTALEYHGEGGHEQPAQPWYSCPSCGKKFEQAGSLMQHARTKHGGGSDMGRALQWGN